MTAAIELDASPLIVFADLGGLDREADWYADRNRNLITIAYDLTPTERADAIDAALDHLASARRPKLTAHSGGGKTTKRRARLSFVAGGAR